MSWRHGSNGSGRTLVCLQDESILSTGRKRQGVKQPGVWRGAWVVCPSSRKEQNENTTALKSVAPTGLGEREILFTLCGASLPGDIESQRRVQRENSAFAKRKREKIHHGGSELFVPFTQRNWVLLRENIYNHIGYITYCTFGQNQ